MRRSRFSLSTLPAADFPVIDDINAQQTVQLPRQELLRLLEKTHFSMAQQDVRYYLNGMLLEIDAAVLRAVATDGHRLALCETALGAKAKSSQQVIVPRKGVLELQRVLTADGTAEVAIGTNHVRAQIGDIRFTSKLIDGRFPEYSRVIPAAPGAAIKADRDVLRQALQERHVVLGPMTRMRADLPGNVPNGLMATYYGQRASQGGLIITEATYMSPTGNGGYASPGWCFLVADCSHANGANETRWA